MQMPCNESRRRSRYSQMRTTSLCMMTLNCGELGDKGSGNCKSKSKGLDRVTHLKFLRSTAKAC